MPKWREWLIRKLGGYVAKSVEIKTIQCKAQKVFSSVTIIPDPFNKDRFDRFIKDAIARGLIDELIKGGFIRYTTDHDYEHMQERITGCIYVVEQPDDKILTFEEE